MISVKGKEPNQEEEMYQEFGPNVSLYREREEH